MTDPTLNPEALAAAVRAFDSVSYSAPPEEVATAAIRAYLSAAPDPRDAEIAALRRQVELWTARFDAAVDRAYALTPP